MIIKIYIIKFIKNYSLIMSKKGFMSQRFTMHDILKPGVRFAT